MLGWLLPEPFPDGHAVDASLPGEPRLGGVAALDEGDSGLLKSGECVELGSAGGGATLGKVGHNDVSTLAHEPVGDGQRFAGLVLVVAGAGVDVVCLGEELVDLIVGQAVVVAEPGIEFVALPGWRAGVRPGTSPLPEFACARALLPI
ncbi:hypothetical protein AB0N21_41320 [Streptomyces sp. NPDC051080]|uniref:hypothetical protein n=1 Tax=Streptomyces sp. NPDC051080 TaxID=3157222 RepID=UPI003432461D